MSRLNQEMIENIEILAKLELNKTEQTQVIKDMEQMLDYIDKLNELDTASVEPLVHVFSDRNVMRADVTTNGDCKQAMLRNAPRQYEGQYQVPKAVE